MSSLRVFFGALLLICCAVFSVSPVLAQNNELPPLIDREVFFGDPEIAGAQLSPDGAYISFRRPYNGVMNIWVKGIDEPFENAVPITASTERPIMGYFWSRDGSRILYSQDYGGDENYHVWSVDPAAAGNGVIPEPLNLTPIEGVRAGIQSVPKNNPEIILVGLNDRDPAYQDIYQVNLITGERELLIENTDGIAGFFFDEDGNVRLGIRQTAGGGTETLIVENGRVGEAIYSCTFEESCYPARVHEDGRRFYFSTNRGDIDLSRFVILDPETGEEELVEEDPEGEVDFAGAAFSDVTGEMLVTYYVGDRIRMYFHQEEFGNDMEYLRSQLPDGEVFPGSMTTDERIWLVSVSSDVDPGSTWLFNRDTREVSFLYRSRPDFPVEHMAEMIPIRYTARDGLEIPAYLTLPKGVEHRNLPVVIHPHGGPWARDMWGYDAYAQFLANRGYAVLQPNFRSSTGYGKAFLNAGNREWGTGAMQHDITDGVQYLIDQGIADPDRIAIFGGSYGGYATLAGVVFTPDLYAAAIPYVAPSSLITLIESFPAYWRPLLEGTWYRRVGDPADPADREDLIARSPLTHVDRITTPLLVVHGANDPRVTQLESDQLVVALRDRGIEVEYIVAQDEGHGFAGEENNMALAFAMEHFLAEHIGGRYQEDAPENIQVKLAEITVDPATVELHEIVEVEEADTEQAVFDGSRISTARLTYDVSMTVMGQHIEFDQVTTVEEVNHDGAAAWKIVAESVMMGMDITDAFIVDQSTLVPLARTMNQAGQVVTFEYTPDNVSINLGAMGGIDIPVDQTLAPDGSVLAYGFGTLPLDEGYSSHTYVVDMTTGGVARHTITVTGIESVTVPAGTFDAYVVEFRAGSGTQVFHISVDDPRVMLKQQATMPAQAGGGSLTAELRSVE